MKLARIKTHISHTIGSPLGEWGTSWSSLLDGNVTSIRGYNNEVDSKSDYTASGG